MWQLSAAPAAPAQQHLCCCLQTCWCGSPADLPCIIASQHAASTTCANADGSGTAFSACGTVKRYAGPWSPSAPAIAGLTDAAAAPLCCGYPVTATCGDVDGAGPDTAHFALCGSAKVPAPARHGLSIAGLVDTDANLRCCEVRVGCCRAPPQLSCTCCACMRPLPHASKAMLNARSRLLPCSPAVPRWRNLRGHRWQQRLGNAAVCVRRCADARRRAGRHAHCQPDRGASAHRLLRGECCPLAGGSFAFALCWCCRQLPATDTCALCWLPATMLRTVPEHGNVWQHAPGRRLQHVPSPGNTKRKCHRAGHVNCRPHPRGCRARLLQGAHAWWCVGGHASWHAVVAALCLSCLLTASADTLCMHAEPVCSQCYVRQHQRPGCQLHVLCTGHLFLWPHQCVHHWPVVSRRQRIVLRGG